MSRITKKEVNRLCDVLQERIDVNLANSQDPNLSSELRETSRIIASSFTIALNLIKGYLL